MRFCRNGWGATIVDGLDTLILAGLETEAIAALNHTVSIDFTRADGLVDPFETIIRYHHRQRGINALTMTRYLGGLVSVVDLLEYGFLGSPFDPRGLAAIRKQAEILAHKLAPGYPPPHTFPRGLGLIVDSTRRRECGFLASTFVQTEEYERIFGAIQLLLPPEREVTSLNTAD